LANAIEWKSFIPIIGALIGVVGTLFVQFFLRKLDEKKIDRKETNIFKGRLGSLLRKLDLCLILTNNLNSINSKKDEAARILKLNFMKLEVYSKLINKLSESEEHFVDNIKFESVQKVNDILLQTMIFIHQIELPEEIKKAHLEKRAFDRNITLYDCIKEECEKLKIIKEKL